MKKIVIILLAAAAPFLFSAFTSDYTLPEGKPGSISFIGDAGSPNTFTVERWRFDEIQNVGSPEDIVIKATMDISSIACSWEDLRKNVLKKKDYFHFKKYGTATIAVKGATALDDGTYSTDATLTLKGISKPITLQFQIDENRVQAEGVVMRRDWGFTGDGPKDEVPVTIDAQLTVQN